MLKKIFLFVFIISLSACKKSVETNSEKKKVKENQWSIEALHQKAQDYLDSTKWDLDLYQQDVDTYKKYPEVFKLPVNKNTFSCGNL